MLGFESLKTLALLKCRDILPTLQDHPLAPLPGMPI